MDSILDEDVKSSAEESCEEQNKAQREISYSLTNPKEDKTIPVSKENEKKPNTEGIMSKDEPRPVSQMKLKMPDDVELQSEMEDARTPSNKDENVFF